MLGLQGNHFLTNVYFGVICVGAVVGGSLAFHETLIRTPRDEAYFLRQDSSYPYIDMALYNTYIFNKALLAYIVGGVSAGIMTATAPISIPLYMYSIKSRSENDDFYE